MKIHPRWTDLFQANGTDGHEAKSRSSLLCDDALNREPHEYAAGCYLTKPADHTRSDQTRLRQDQTRLINQLAIDKTSHSKQYVRFVSSTVPPLSARLRNPCHVFLFPEVINAMAIYVSKATFMKLNDVTTWPTHSTPPVNNRALRQNRDTAYRATLNRSTSTLCVYIISLVPTVNEQ